MWRGNLEISSRKWILLTFLMLSYCRNSWTISAIEHLEGEAGFRMASLQWKYPPASKAPISFRVRYCELHNWGMHRCRYQQVAGEDEQQKKSTNRIGRRQGTAEAVLEDVFLIEIGGLRMATNYSFQVVPQDLADENGGQPSQISLQTKGFSAKATKCLANSSDVLVETGPFFGGRISVEDSEEKTGCFVQGDPLSPQTQYTMRIQHSECGSMVNGSKVTTVILVQENVPILTHSTRKFIVLCSFSPESFTVKTGVSLPRDTSVAKALDFSRLIRISPQNSNLLVADRGDPANRGRPQPPGSTLENHNNINIKTEEDLVHQSSNSLQEEDNTKTTPNSVSRRQGRAYAATGIKNNLIAASTSTSEQMLKQNEQREGNWETYLVFGMICMAIVASLSSVGWFINSYRKSGVGRTQRLQVEEGDGDSEVGSQVSSTFDDCSSGEFSKDQRSPHNLDTRSELEVELDFEFSEDRNPSPFRSQLDYQNSEPTSHA